MYAMPAGLLFARFSLRRVPAVHGALAYAPQRAPHRHRPHALPNDPRD
jgi:hypothetical protein